MRLGAKLLFQGSEFGQVSLQHRCQHMRRRAFAIGAANMNGFELMFSPKYESSVTVVQNYPFIFIIILKKISCEGVAAAIGVWANMTK